MATVDHVVVLALENRSFDHMLGALPHPSPEFEGIGGTPPPSNPGWGGGAPVPATVGAKPVLPVGPDHAHDAVMAQLGITSAAPPWRPTNQGFVLDYERICRRIPLGARWTGLLGGPLNWWERRRTASEQVITGRGPLVMLVQPPQRVPVLSTLATEFAVCTRWFASVPGETWPNRNFLHAATSDGEVDIDTRFYYNPTTFELLSSQGRSWRIYHDDTPQVWAFPRLWDTEEHHANWFPLRRFRDDVAAGQLADYTFIEPNHRPPFHTLDHAPIIGTPDISDNQHPENNLVGNAAYDTFAAADTDFARGEALIAEVYEALRARPDLFARTLLLITYDEHGGFHDHVLPPTHVPAPSAQVSLSPAVRFLHALYHRRAAAFDFTMLGVRVPAVVVSPLVSRGAVDTRTRDHAGVPATLRALFSPGADPLTRRDAWSPPFHDLLTLDLPRGDLPDLSSFTPPADRSPETPVVQEPVGDQNVPAYYDHFLALADAVHEHLVRLHEKETVGRRLRPPTGPSAPPTCHASSPRRRRGIAPSAGEGRPSQLFTALRWRCCTRAGLLRVYA